MKPEQHVAVLASCPVPNQCHSHSVEVAVKCVRFYDNNNNNILGLGFGPEQLRKWSCLNRANNFNFKRRS